MQVEVTITQSAALKGENNMNEMKDTKKDQGEGSGQWNQQQQHGQTQQKHDDPSKKNPSQDRNMQDDKQKQQDQGGQRRAS
jgi:hypothetical protein